MTNSRHEAAWNDKTNRKKGAEEWCELQERRQYAENHEGRGKQGGLVG